MSRTKVFISLLMILILIALSGASVWAAPGGQEPTAEPTEEPTAEPTEEPTAEPTEEPTAEPTEEPTDEEPPAVHPVASALAEFFADTLGLDYDGIMDHHEDGMGFGVIAQACWMSYAMEGDATLLGDILEAKKSGDFSSITLPDGETAKNWGQFRKAVLGSDKAKKNLGAIMSGRAEIATPEPTTPTTEAAAATNPGNGKKDKGEKSEKPPGKEKNKSKESAPSANPPGKEKDKGEDSGPPAKSPGKEKDKGGGDKGGNKGKKN